MSEQTETYFRKERHKEAGNQFPDRFKDPQKLSVNGEPGGVELVASIEGANILFDFGRPIQTLGITLQQAQAVILMLMEAATAAHAKAEITVNH